MSIRINKIARGFLARRRVNKILELQEAVLVAQRAVRGWLSKRLVQRMVWEANRLSIIRSMKEHTRKIYNLTQFQDLKAELIAAVKLQNWWRVIWQQTPRSRVAAYFMRL